MQWLSEISWFFGGAFLANALPHLAAGTMGRPFQTPFANPPGEGLSSSTVNVLWGFFNLAVAYLLICRVGTFDLHDIAAIGAVALGGLALSLFVARHFGRFYGGNTPLAGPK